jgi:hypothetical protein
MDLAMTRALSLLAPNIAWVNCLSIYFNSESLVIPLTAACSSGVHIASKQSTTNAY